MFFLIFNIVIFVFPENNKIKTKQAISLDNLLLRKGPSKKDDVLLKLHKGDILDIISSSKEISKINDMEDYWYNVRVNNKIGYVYGFYISPIDTSPFVISEKNGLILFINKNKKIINELKFRSNYQETQSIKKDGVTRKDLLYDIPEIIDNFLIIKNVSGWYQSEYVINYYLIFNKVGKKICKINDFPILCISNKNKYLLLNIINKKESKIDIYSFDGILIKSIKNLKNNQTVEVNNDKFLFDKSEKYFIWVSNTSVLIVNLKNLKSETISYDLKEYSNRKYYTEILEASLSGKILNISLSIKLGNNEEKKSLKIDMDLIK